MNQIVTTGIILSRTDFGEANRILSLLTPDHGKIRLMAKGVRKSKSKLAGGIELFSVSSITYIKGRGDIGTLISTRLITHFGNIVQDIDRTMLGYELIKLLDKVTEDQPDADYFHLLEQAFQSLNDPAIHADTITLWFSMQLLNLSGHQPELSVDQSGAKLRADQRYQFDYERMAFAVKSNGTFSADHIKVLRLSASSEPAVVNKVKNLDQLREPLLHMLKTILLQRIH